MHTEHPISLRGQEGGGGEEDTEEAEWESETPKELWLVGSRKLDVCMRDNCLQLLHPHYQFSQKVVGEGSVKNSMRNSRVGRE